MLWAIATVLLAMWGPVILSGGGVRPPRRKIARVCTGLIEG